MDIQDQLTAAESLLKGVALSFSRPEENRLDAVIPVEKVKEAVTALLIEGKWGYLSAITGLDNPEYELDPETKEKKVVPEKGSLELLYHFCEGAAITSLRVSLSYIDPAVDSICDLLPSASFYERETMELLGITFRDTPITDHLILPENWPTGVYPLRKSFTGLEKSPWK